MSGPNERPQHGPTRTHRSVISAPKHSAHHPATANQLSAYGRFHDMTSSAQRIFEIGDERARRTAVNGAGTLCRNSIRVACPATAGEAANVARDGDVDGDDAISLASRIFQVPDEVFGSVRWADEGGGFGCAASSSCVGQVPFRRTSLPLPLRRWAQSRYFFHILHVFNRDL